MSNLTAILAPRLHYAINLDVLTRMSLVPAKAPSASAHGPRVIFNRLSRGLPRSLTHTTAYRLTMPHISGHPFMCIVLQHASWCGRHLPRLGVVLGYEALNHEGVAAREGSGEKELASTYQVFKSGTRPIPASAPITYPQPSLSTTTSGTGPIPKIHLISYIIGDHLGMGPVFPSKTNPANHHSVQVQSRHRSHRGS